MAALQRSERIRGVSLGLPFDFCGNFVPRHIVARRGSVRQLGTLVDALGLRRVMVICGTSVKSRTPLVGIIEKALGARRVATFDGVEPHTPLSSVRAGAAMARQVRPDGLLSVGGGSAHDTAKMIGLLYAEETDDLAQYRIRFEPPDRLVVPSVRGQPPALITVPTTFSAADVVGGGAFTIPETGVKGIVVNAKLTPTAVVLDGEAVATTPCDVLLATGMNAFNHCIETTISRSHQPVSDAWAFYAARMLHHFLPLIHDDPEDVDAREGALVAACLSGLTYGNAGLGVTHALCHFIGGRYRVPHGVANAIMMPHGIRFNAPVAAETLADMARFMGVEADQPSPGALAEALAARLEHLRERFSLPGRLRDVGIPRAELPALAREALSDPQAYFNPRPVTEADLLTLLEAAW